MSYIISANKNEKIKIKSNQIKSKVVRCGEHSDYGSITLLIQVMGWRKTKTYLLKNFCRIKIFVIFAG